MRRPRDIGPSTENADLARKLNAAGHRTGTRRAFDAEAVRVLRRSYGIPAPGVLAPEETTVADIAARLGVTRSTITLWIQRGLLTARKTTHRYCVTFDSAAEAACRARIASSPWVCRSDDTEPTPHDRTPVEIAAQLGVSQEAVYNWIRRGYLPPAEAQVGAPTSPSPSMSKPTAGNASPLHPSWPRP